MTAFDRYIGIDYSGAGEPTERNSALRLFETTSVSAPGQIRAANGWNWTRRELAVWLDVELRKPVRTIVGIDHAFSFPHAYFGRYGIPTWDLFLDDFIHHWPADCQPVEGLRTGNARVGTTDELRLCDRWTAGAKSVFLFDVAGAVAMSTHAGLPFLRSLRRANSALHFWPFDGWQPEPGRSIVAEVYPSLFRRRYARVGSESDDAHDARSVCTWLHERDQLGFLPSYFEPALNAHERGIAALEGWILGVM